MFIHRRGRHYATGAFLLTVLILLLFYKFPENKWRSLTVSKFEDGYCPINMKLLRGLDQTFCVGDGNIFFIESSSANHLTERQLCAVESATLHHPDRNVWVLMTSATPLSYSKEPLMKEIDGIHNLRILRIEFKELVSGSPLQTWWNKAEWKGSSHKTVHLSDVMRLFLLWQYGGIYLDLDVVVLQEMSGLRNTVASDNGENAGNSFMAFNAGHPLMMLCISEFCRSYDPNQYAANGPVLLNRVIKKYCRVDSAKKLLPGKDARCDVAVLPREAIYPVAWGNWMDYFRSAKATNLTEAVYNGSFAIHVWNKLSRNARVFVGENSLYELAMKKHCPSVYKYVSRKSASL